MGLIWSACTDDPTAACTTLPVPVDWADPYSPKMSLAVAMRPATDPAHRIGALIVNPGGPGVSGYDFAVGAASFFTPRCGPGSTSSATTRAGSAAATRSGATPPCSPPPPRP